MRRFIQSAAIACSLFVASPILHAEQMQQLGNWDVHYIVMPTTMLDPQVASQYQLSRSKNYQLLNVSVLDHQSQQAQAVQITGEAVNLAGQQQTLTFREISEQHARYYIAGVEARSEQKMRITIKIRQGSTEHVLKFDQDVYPE